MGARINLVFSLPPSGYAGCLYWHVSLPDSY